MSRSVPAAEPTPAALGYRWPSEWARHAATWLAWPHNRETWPGKFGPVPGVFASLTRALSRYEPVVVLGGARQSLAEARRLVGGLPNVTLADMATNDSWIRDYGPTFLAGPPGLPRALVDWRYNAWGGKYPPFDEDAAVAERIARLRGMRRFAPDLVMEGGAIDGNGRGTVLTTESCLLDPRRNPGLSREAIQQTLLQMLGAQKIVWLPGGLMAGDDTDGHVDQLARFVGPTSLVAALEQDPTDPNYAMLRENFQRLGQQTDQDGRPLQVTPLPMPRAIYFNGQRLPASYCNFYIANDAVLVPQFDDPADEQAIRVLAEQFPDRDVFGLPARDVVLGLGAFHCLTQQEPAE